MKQKSLARRIGLLILLPSLMGVWGCFSSGTASEGDSEAKELKGKDEATTSEAPEPELIRTAKKLYQSSLYTGARESLQSLHDRHPMGAYGQFAELKLADSYFFNREYIQASKLYEDFIKEYPGSPDLPYAKLQAARSNAFSARGSGRDRTPLERALTLYDELADRYPTTHYGAVAEQERRPVVQQLAEYDLMIIDFYFKKENAEAAAARQKLYDERWSARLNASSTAGLEERSLREAFAGASSGAPVAPKPIHSADDTTDTPTPSSEFEEYSVVQRVECFKDGNPYVLIEVGQLPQGFDGSLAVEELTPKNGAITLARYKLKSEIPTYDCFGSADLRFGADGRVSLKTTSPAVATTVDNPARILITLSRQ